MSLLLVGQGALRSLAEDGPWSGSSGSMPTGGGSTPAEGGSFPDLPASSLLQADPHSGTTFDIIGSVGIALLVIVGAMSCSPR
ncbi:hypothetical protein [Streptomyces griseorubiginosus]|uniref:hypothetical protein n=1 Tax=Streptomyces griseorubiginosus TaxID=67304 RepID=UPI00215B0D99|nr:hypothetical protein [Streptomyces griseorubiginosus]